MNDFTEQTLQVFLEELKERNVEIHAVTAIKDGKILLNRAYFPFESNSIHPLYSVTKSFTSLAFGFLKEENKIDIDTPWIHWFPEYKETATSEFGLVTLRHLLTMTLGQDQEVMIKHGDDWIEQIIRKPIVYKPGTVFFYNSMCSYLIGRLVERVSGETLLNYLGKRLFKPLHIEDVTWECDEEGHCLGGFGLHMKTCDLAKVGQCILDDGVFESKQIISKEWLKEAVSKQVENATQYPEERTQNRQGYGYYFWMCTNGAYRCSGLHGQMCYMDPNNNLVIALSSCTTGSQIILNCLDEAKKKETVTNKPLAFEIPLIKGQCASEYAKTGIYEAFSNSLRIGRMELINNEEVLKVTFFGHESVYSFVSESTCWHEQDNSFYDFIPFYCRDAMSPYELKNQKLFAQHAWVSKDICHVQLRCRDASTAYDLLFRFDPKYVTLTCSVKGLLTTLTCTETVFSMK